MMNSLLLLLSLGWALDVVVGAPAVSSVHVSFVSGNKATQYSHGTGGVGNLVEYHLLEDLLGNGGHTVRKRSVLRGQSRDPGRTRGRAQTTDSTTTTATEPSYSSYSTKLTPTIIPYRGYTDDVTTDNKESSTIPTSSTRAHGTLKTPRKSVRFIAGPSSTSTRASALSRDADKPTVMTGARLDTELPRTPYDSSKPKDTKAVKRSPVLGNSFASSFAFPDFDEFGGDAFGSLRHFAPANTRNTGAGSHRASHTAHNPEALAPDGVFIPPIATEASHYQENDPYLADPETAADAAKHPPFFTKFPHKRTVLALNERREDNGLEPNLLRSIRPFFPFFENNNSL